MKYPLVEKCGLKVYSMTHFEDKFVRAEDLEKLLESAPQVIGYHTDLGYHHFEDPFGGEKSLDGHTHSARLVMIEPIENTCEHKRLNPQTPDGLFYCLECQRYIKPTGWQVYERGGE